MPLPDLLQWLATVGKSGTLRVERNRVAKWIQLSKGRVVGCSSDDPPHRLGQYLLSRGKVTEEQLRQALSAQSKTGQHLGRILVDMGVLSQNDLTAHLEAKAEETIYSLFDWNDAIFRFDDGLDNRSDIFPVDLQVQDILLRGLKRFDEMQRIRRVFHDPGIVLRYTAKPPPPEVFNNKMARTIYATIDGDRSIAETLLHVHGSEYVVYKFLFELHRNGYIELSHVKPAGEAPAPAHALALQGVAEALTIAAPVPRMPIGMEMIDLSPTPAAASAPPPLVTEDPEPQSLEGRLAAARSLMADGQHDRALGVLDALYREHPSDDALRRLTAEAEAAFVDKAYRHYLPPDKIPVLTMPVEALEAQQLSPPDFFLLSRIDGSWDVKSIIQIAPLREVDALRTLKRMRESGMIRLKDPDS